VEPQERQRSLKGPREQRALHIRNDDDHEVLISAVILGLLVQGLFPSRLQEKEEVGEGLLLYDWAWEERKRRRD
jgi:hypothetical protein